MFKKVLKKVMAVATVAAMTVSMSVSAFAATPVDDEITVPVKVVLKSDVPENMRPDGYIGSLAAGTVIREKDVTISADADPTAMDFIKAADLDITVKEETDGSEYIQGINGFNNVDLVYTDHYYKGYSWMIQMKAGNEVIPTGTKPDWADPAPAKNAWFASTLAVNNVNMNGTQYFPYNYYDQAAGGFTTSVEAITLEYTLTESEW